MSIAERATIGGFYPARLRRDRAGAGATRRPRGVISQLAVRPLRRCTTSP